MFAAWAEAFGWGTVALYQAGTAALVLLGAVEGRTERAAAGGLVG